MRLKTIATPRERYRQRKPILSRNCHISSRLHRNLRFKLPANLSYIIFTLPCPRVAKVTPPGRKTQARCTSTPRVHAIHISTYKFLPGDHKYLLGCILQSQLCMHYSFCCAANVLHVARDFR